MRGSLTINLEALAANWEFFRKTAGGSECAGVIKANGYGLGLSTVAPALWDAGARSFFVARLEEGIQARNCLPKGATIFVLDGVFDGEIDETLAASLVPILNTPAQVTLWLAQGVGAPCGLHLDTGMNRLGLSPEEAESLNESAEALNLALVMSHLACSSDPESPINKAQRDAFARLAMALPYAPLSLANSGGALLGIDYCFDMIRPGIGVYGGGPFDQIAVPLQPVVTMTAPILSVRDVGPGDSVGYGATWTADRRRRIATVALGYADGFLRTGSSRGFAVLNGAVCPIVGRISMDLIGLDVTGAGKGAIEGAQMEFLGSAAPIDAQAQACGTIPYELLVRMGDRFERTIIG
jgi:alanine racemase